MIGVLVGKHEEPYFIHERILSRNSLFFEAALKKEWKEGQTRTVKLPEEDSAVFGRYANYLYTGSLACQGNSIDAEYTVLADAYILGETMLDDHYQHAVLDAIIQTFQEDRQFRYPVPTGFCKFRVPDIDFVNKVYQYTTASSPLRKFLVDTYTVRANGNYSFEIAGQKADPEFLMDLVKSFSARRVIKESERDTFQEKITFAASAYRNDEKTGSGYAKRRKLA